MIKHESSHTREELLKSKDNQNKWSVRSFFIYALAGMTWTIAAIDKNETVASFMLPDYSREDTGCGINLENSRAIESIKEKIANECIESKTGRVALVWYGMDDIYAQKLADDAEMAVPYSFESMLMPEVIPVAITKEVADRFVDVNPEQCFDEKDSSKYLSKIADETMNLSAYDEVIGITPYRSCDEDSGTAGVNHPDKAGRYSMIVDTVQEKRGRGDFNSRVFAHEFGHAKGLFHASRVGDGNIFLNPFNVKDQNVDLNSILKAKSATEYGDDSNIMGCGEYSLSAPQKRELLIPEILLGKIDDPRSNITRTGITYNRQTFNDIMPYAALDLGAPVGIKMFNAEDKNKRELSLVNYDQLVIEPHFSLGDTDAAGAQVFLIDTNRMQTLSFGYLYEKKIKADQTYEIHVGKKTVSLKVNHDTIEVKDVSEA